MNKSAAASCLLLGALAVSATTGCVQSGPDEIGRQTLSIIDGSPALDLSAVVRVAHADARESCSGTLIAPTYVATALHCTFGSDATGDHPLPVDGFEVGFGANLETLTTRTVESVEWIGSPEEVVIADAVARGEDVAVLQLSSPAPPDSAPATVEFDYLPRGSDSIIIAGFGLSSLDTGSNGERLQATTKPTGFDSATGVVQLEGNSACFGDSGGPMLRPSGALIGTIGEIGGSSDASFCDIGMTFGPTVANAGVSSFLQRVCESTGGCGPSSVLPEGGTDAALMPGDAAARDAGPDWPMGELPLMDASADARPTLNGLRVSGGCTMTTPSPGLRPPFWIVLAMVSVFASICRAAMRRRD